MNAGVPGATLLRTVWLALGSMILATPAAMVLAWCRSNLAGRMGAAAQRRVLERYTERRILPILDNAYQQAMRTSGWVQRAERERPT